MVLGEWVVGQPFASHLITNTPVFRLLLNHRKTEPYRANFIQAPVSTYSSSIFKNIFDREEKNVK